MNINDLRKIGESLKKEVASIQHYPDIKKIIGQGASGDKTFFIDKRAEEIIIEGLKLLKEPFTIISEEIGIIDINGGGKRVIIDPIDGSKNAISGIPFYCTSIAVADGDSLNDIKLSYIINLINGNEFWAKQNSGAFLNNKQINTRYSPSSKPPAAQSHPGSPADGSPSLRKSE